MNSADYAVQASKGIKESFDNGSYVRLAEYVNLPIFKMEQTNEFSEIFTSTESMTGAKTLAESETPPVLKLEDGYSVTLTEKRFGGALIVTETMQRQSKDNTTKIDTFLQRQRDMLLSETDQVFITDCFQMLNQAFLTSATYLAPDGAPLCAISGTANHTWNTAGSTAWNNGVTPALSSTAIDTAMTYAGAFTDASGKPMPLNFNVIVVKKGSAAERTARKLFAEGISPVTINDINLYYGEMTIVSTPYITAANTLNWFLFDTTKVSPLYVGVGEYPTLREPIKLENEDVRTNVTGFYKLGVNNMPFSIYGSTGAT